MLVVLLLLLLLLLLEVVGAAYVHWPPLLLLRRRLLLRIPQAEAALEGRILHASLLQISWARAGRGNAAFSHQAVAVCASHAAAYLRGDSAAREAVSLGLPLEETGGTQAVVCTS